MKQLATNKLTFLAQCVMRLGPSSYWLPAPAPHLLQSFFLQIKKKSMDKAKQEERMSKDFATMEEAALKAYQKDLKRMEMESGICVTFHWNDRGTFAPWL